MKMLCVVVDGLQSDALACAHAGCLDRLAREGVASRKLVTVSREATLPALHTLMTSMWPDEHGVTTDTGFGTATLGDVSLAALLHSRQRTVSLFHTRDCVNSMIPARLLGHSLFLNSRRIRNMDSRIAEAAARHLQKEKPDFCLLYMDGVEISRRHFGFMSECYLEAIETADRAIAHILEQIRVVGLQDEYVLLILGGPGSRRLAHLQNKIMLILNGRGIVRGLEIRNGLSLLDMAPTMAEILDVPPHPDWRGRVLREALCGSSEHSAAGSSSISLELLEPKVVRPAA